MSLVEGGERERWDAPDHIQGILLLNWGETELNLFVTCMMLKAKANDMRHLAHCQEDFVVHDLVFADQGEHTCLADLCSDIDQVTVTILFRCKGGHVSIQRGRPGP
ncbi:hypothetical protein TNCV_3191481 [Trichonephila clavipes]|nr:hypothetical protein TNCV_3191481 [Trichonephila clavipes]